jgi:hypothetical protein
MAIEAKQESFKRRHEVMLLVCDFAGVCVDTRNGHHLITSNVHLA